MWRSYHVLDVEKKNKSTWWSYHVLGRLSQLRVRGGLAFFLDLERILEVGTITQGPPCAFLFFLNFELPLSSNLSIPGRDRTTTSSTFPQLREAVGLILEPLSLESTCS
jgi:hypothetical protein